jgi:hypothetical protein
VAIADFAAIAVTASNFTLAENQCGTALLVGMINVRAGEGTRTLNVKLGKLALYQLSYARIGSKDSGII